jgi:hypothetical protein
MPYRTPPQGHEPLRRRSHELEHAADRLGRHLTHQGVLTEDLSSDVFAVLDAARQIGVHRDLWRERRGWEMASPLTLTAASNRTPEALFATMTTTRFLEGGEEPEPPR